MNALSERYEQAAYKAAKLYHVFAAAESQKGTTFELQVRRDEVLTERALVTYLALGWRWERLTLDGHVLETWERGNMSDFLPWVLFQFEYAHVRIGGTFHEIPALLPQGDGSRAKEADARPGTTEAEAVVMTLLYKLLTFYAKQAIYDNVPLSMQEYYLMESGQIAKFERYPLLPSLPWGKPLEEAITWSLANGRKFKILVQDITEEYSRPEERHSWDGQNSGSPDFSA